MNFNSIQFNSMGVSPRAEVQLSPLPSRPCGIYSVAVSLFLFALHVQGYVCIEVLLSKRRTGHADSRLCHVATTPVRVLLYASPRCVFTRPHDYKLQFCNKKCCMRGRFVVFLETFFMKTFFMPTGLLGHSGLEFWVSLRCKVSLARCGY